MQLRKQLTAPTNYEECATSPGSRIQESYPATCITAGGLRFVQPIIPTPPETQVMGIRLSDCCTCPTEIPASLVGKNGWALYEAGKDYTSERPTACKAVMCKPCEIPTQTPQTSPTSLTTPKPGKYTCPSNGWADCMPGPGKNMSGCSPEAMDWYEANCPNFQGGAY